MRIYPVNDLPSVIHLGKQTEKGVREVRLDCAVWKALWPSLDFSVWVTPPGGKSAYPAVTHMEGDVLVWPVSDADTAVSGDGYMEVMGMAEGLKKLSAITTTRIMSTTTGATSDPPPPSQPWVDKVLEAADRAEAAAERAESASGSGGGSSEPGAPGEDGGYYQPSVTDGVLSWTPSKGDMPSVPASDVRGPAGQDGQSGKTAYQYAREGGYTGTEAEFAQKLAAEEGVYELIETITVEEEVASISRTQEPDGTPYNFKAMHINTLMEIGKVASAINYLFNSANATGGNHIATAFKSCGQAKAWVENGVIDAYTAYGVSGKFIYAQMYKIAQVNTMKKADAIKTLRIDAVSTAMPVGSTIEIWGVRA